MVRQLGKSVSADKVPSLPLIIFILLVGSGVVLTPVEVTAQGTTLAVEDTELTSGDTATLYLQLKEAIDGLGRIDATIVSSNTDVLQLKSIAPEAVSQQFLQVDSKSESGIKFKLVDLGKKVDPGDTNVQLVSFGVAAVKGGEAKINLEGIKYTDEEGNVIEPEVNQATVTVSSQTQKEETAESSSGEKAADDEESKVSEEEGTSEGTKTTDEPTQKGKEEQEKGSGEEDKEGKDTYVPEIGGLKLKLGEKGKVKLNLSSLQNGLRLVDAAVISAGGVALDGVVPLNPTYSEVVEHTVEMIGFRMGDFDGNVSAGAPKLTMAELRLEGIKVGTTRLRLKLTLWTDRGNKIVRTTRSGPIEVKMGTIGDAEKPPIDPDGDGLYEDVNGDGELNREDPFALAFNLESESVTNSAALFDFNWDGSVSFEDSVELMREIEER